MDMQHVNDLETAAKAAERRQTAKNRAYEEFRNERASALEAYKRALKEADDNLSRRLKTWPDLAARGVGMGN